MKALEQECGRLLAQNNKLGLRKTIGLLLRGRRLYLDRFFWPNALLIHALSYNREYRDTVRYQADLWRRKNFRIDKLDDVLMAYVLLYKADVLSEKDKEVIQANVIHAVGKYRNTSIPYRKEYEDIIYADLLGMVPQFLCRIGIERQSSDMVLFATEQFNRFLSGATDLESGLPYHAFNARTGEKLGIIGWGRALGWILTGLSECVVALSSAFPEEAGRLRDIYEDLLNVCIKYQRKDGGFSWQLQAIDGPLDSSASGLILQSMCVLESSGLLKEEFQQYEELLLTCLNRCEQNGKVLHASAECGGIGIYPQRYGSYAWSVSPYLVSLEMKGQIGNRV